jgi:hypothetical protein
MELSQLTPLDKKKLAVIQLFAERDARTDVSDAEWIEMTQDIVADNLASIDMWVGTLIDSPQFVFASNHRDKADQILAKYGSSVVRLAKVPKA